jgi:two-component system, LytTR family, response regulator
MKHNIKTILVDDEPRGLTSLEKLLQFNCPEVQIVAKCSNADSALQEIRKTIPDLIFMDIAMPGKNGFEILKELDNYNAEVIFVTAHNQFMIEAFRFSAIDYLLKPVDDELLVAAVQRTAKRVSNKTKSNLQLLQQNLIKKSLQQNLKLCIHSLKGFQVVELDEILYAEAAGNYTYFHLLNNQNICTSKPIHEFEELLKDSGFVRVHKSFLVNLLHVKQYIKGEGGSIFLSDGTEIEVSRRKKEIFISCMKSYFKY